MAAALSMARGAGKLVIGFDAVEEALKKKRVKIVVTAEDIAARTLRNTVFAAGDDIPIFHLPFGQAEIEAVFRRRFVVAAVTDEHFRDLFLRAAEGFEEAGGLRQEEVGIW